MAGQIQGIFKEKFSPFLRTKLEEARKTEGEKSDTVRVIEGQYLRDAREELIEETTERRRHYEADMPITHNGRQLRGVERLYRRVVLIEPTTACAAHCRWCLRGQYPVMSLSEEELQWIAQYCGGKEVKDDIREVLITGGDPLMVPDRLDFLIEALQAEAPNVKIVRIGSRVPIHDPERVGPNLLHALRPRSGLRVEIGTHINHSAELFEEVKNSYQRLQDNGLRIYNQSVLLKGINDTKKELVTLFDELRYIGIETHYLFHCIPMRGMAHHRTSVNKGLDLIRNLTSSGDISGRCKPMFTAMTDLGKVTLYDGVIIAREGRNILLRSGYRFDDRVKWNPVWKLPESASVSEDGYMNVWYRDSDSE
jgi:lysine 2,3-aminomutase